VDAQEQAGYRRILEVLGKHRAPDSLDDFREALTQLQRRGLDLIPVFKILTLAMGHEENHRRDQSRKQRGMAFQTQRARVRKQLGAASAAALDLYRAFYEGDDSLKPPIYVLCRELHDALKAHYVDVVKEALADPVRASRDAALLPDPLYNDAVWTKRLAQARRGSPEKAHVKSARAQLASVGVTKALATVLLRGVGTIP